MNSIHIIAFASNILSYRSLADSTSSFSVSCVPGSQQTVFPACNHFLNFGNTCPNLPTDEAWKECLCNQDYINSLFGCESEVRLCFQDGDQDYQYQSALSLWHSLCNTFLPSSLTITTPLLSTITAEYRPLCPDEEQACQTARLIYDNCGMSFTNHDAPFTSCYCQPGWLSLDYQCEFLGNTSCAGIPATLSNLIGYDCPNFQDIIGTGLPTSGSVVTISGQSMTSNSLITPAPSRTATTASQTATMKSSEGCRSRVSTYLIWIVFSLLIFTCIL
ncbi:hypothetical protein N431DRAFT_500027 [Stipitochalara longipes BDJ]|nr:hypothetical protein N431DRAFT_500027 [Stipitochalara longipes BDJ]